MERKKPSRKRNNTIFVTLCVMPALIAYIVFMIIPTFNIFQMSLFKWSGFSAVKQFVGLDNFNILLRDNNFIRAFQNTVLLLVIVTAITMAFALLLATIMSGHQLKGKSIYHLYTEYFIYRCNCSDLFRYL